MKKKFIFLLTLVMAFTLCLAFASCDKGDKNQGKITSGTIAAEGNFAEGVTLSASKLDTTDVGYAESVGKVSDKEYDKEKIAVFDISLVKDNAKVQPNGKIKITMPAPFKTENGYVTYHISGDKVEELATTYANGNITFETTSFSYFVVAGTTSGSVIGPGGLTPNDPTKNFFAYIDSFEQATMTANGTEVKKNGYSATLKEGDKVELVAKANDGYRMVGWYKNSKSSGSDDRYDKNSNPATFTYSGTDKMFVYARFEVIEYKIAVILNGGEFKAADTVPSVYNVETQTFTLPEPERANFIFNGWEVSDGKKITKIEKGTTGDITLTALWQPLSDDNLFAYADQPGQGYFVVERTGKDESYQTRVDDSYSTKVKEGETITMTAHAGRGYEVAGWYTDSKASGKGHIHINKETVSFEYEEIGNYNGAIVTAYARFTPIRYGIYYNLEGGTMPAGEIPDSFNIESETIVLPIPTRENYRFDGWLWGKKTILTKIEHGSAKDIIITATWTQIKGFDRSIEIIKDSIGEVEQGIEAVTPEEYVVKQNGEEIVGTELTDEHGEVIVEYKKSGASDSSYTSVIPTELGNYMVRVRITQSTTDPYYAEAVSSAKPFTVITRVISTKLNVLNNMVYDPTSVRESKIVPVVDVSKNPVLLLEEVLGGDEIVKGYMNASQGFIGSVLWKEYCERYTEIRVGSVDGVTIGRFRIYCAYKFEIENKYYDDNNFYIQDEYYPIFLYGSCDGPLMYKVNFELVPGVEGYTDAQGKWICYEKKLDVVTYSDNSDEFGGGSIGPSGLFGFGGFNPQKYNGYKDLKDEGIATQAKTAWNLSDNCTYERAYASLTLDYFEGEIRKYDLIIEGDVKAYLFDYKTRNFVDLPLSSSGTVQTFVHTAEHPNTVSLMFIVKKGGKVTAYNGKYSEYAESNT